MEAENKPKGKESPKMEAENKTKERNHQSLPDKHQESPS